MLSRGELFRGIAGLTPDDKLLLAHLNDCRKAAEKKGAPVFSFFMDPARAEKFKSMFPSGVIAWGGYADAERRMLGFFPEGYTGINGGADVESGLLKLFPIEILRAEFNPRFNSPPSHRDYLGALMGLGLERGKIGDIRLADNGALIYVCGDVAGYIASALERAGSTPVKVSRVTFDDAEASAFTEPAGKQSRINVASLRLDAVVAAAFRLSRGKAAALIEGERVFVNWVETVSRSKVLKEGDMITVRGLGRVKIDGEAGRTKKDRYVLMVTGS